MIILLYSLLLLYLFLFSMAQVHLLFSYSKKRKDENNGALSISNSLPTVTIQLPIYNEQYVIDRLITAINSIEYPKELLDIQLLDDSTDLTSEIIKTRLKEMGNPPHILHIQRTSRQGYKAGALSHGLSLAKGQFIAIFDADFIPQPDFLLVTLLRFTENIGMIQTRWGHLNRDYNSLTKMQAFGLDAHFSIEQTGRKSAGSFINFNGTGGIWRKDCIIDAGGWSADTLTEDLDLSYRAQLKGWKFDYIENYEAPAELPIIMGAVKSQQYRWNKGAAETAKKHLWNVLKSKLSLKQKIHAFFHLQNSSVFPVILLAGILSLPVLITKANHPEYDTIFNFGFLFFLGFLSIAAIYRKSYFTGAKSKSSPKFLLEFFSFITVSMGLSFHNGIAVMEGWLGRKTPFVRTPKFNVEENHPITKNSYIIRNLTLVNFFEGVLSLYFGFGIVLGLFLQEYSLLLFHGMLFLGFGAVFIYSIQPLKDEK